MQASWCRGFSEFKSIYTEFLSVSCLQVEDIIDTGKTALKLKEKILNEGALSVKLVTLLDKAERRECSIQPDYCCFKVTYACFLQESTECR